MTGTRLAGASGSPGFDFTLHMRRLCADMAARLPELAHIDMTRVAIRFCQARKAVRHGMQASADAAAIRRRRAASPCAAAGAGPSQRIYDAAGHEMLYLLSFYLPRFLEHSLAEKLATVIHELWHIGPRVRRRSAPPSGPLLRPQPFAAAVRRRDGTLDRQVAGPRSRRRSCYEFLRYNFRQLQKQSGPIFGTRIATPKLIRLAAAS